MTLRELGDAVAFFLQLGSPVVVPGLGWLRLTADRHGESCTCALWRRRRS